jgi:Flp pilus assembly protein TadD
MSLLNDVLRDLQTRGAFGPEPLTGLEPVLETHAPQTSRSLPLFMVLALAVAALLLAWPTMMNVPRPELPSLAVASTTTQSVAVPAVELQTTPPPVPQPVQVAAPETTQIEQLAVVEVISSPPRAAPAPVVEARRAPTAVEDSPTTIYRRNAHDRAASAASWLDEGLRALQANNLAAAERYFQDAIDDDTANGAAWSYLYSTQVKAGNLTAAEQTLRMGLTAAKDPAALAKLYARMLLDRGNTGAAVRVLQDYRPPVASDAEYDAFLAAMLQKKGQFALAGDIYRQLLDRNPDSASLWIGLAMSSDSLGNPEDALAAFHSALRADPLKPPLARYAARRISELEAND